jgi:hypothetical protein
MKKIYLLSNGFDYSKMVSSASGPEQAERNGWETDSLSNVSDHLEKWILIDNRLTEKECKRVPEVVQKHRSTPFCFVVIDPYEEWCRDHWYYRLLFRLAGEENVFFLSKYTPDEVVEDIRRQSGADKMVVLPYPYPREQEVSTPWEVKDAKVFFSGNQNANVYPYRHKFNNVSRYWPFANSKVSKLEHPGYPDIGENKKHNIVGKKYVKEISNHQFMFISPSRCHLEFLKYGECAAAGSVPVGVPPEGFTPEMRAPFVELDFTNYLSLIRSMHALFAMSEEERASRAKEYRQAMKKYRSVDRINEKLNSFIKKVWST